MSLSFPYLEVSVLALLCLDLLGEKRLVSQWSPVRLLLIVLEAADKRLVVEPVISGGAEPVKGDSDFIGTCTSHIITG